MGYGSRREQIKLRLQVAAIVASGLSIVAFLIATFIKVWIK